MTHSAFDPICFGQYPAGEEPHMLHFMYEGSDALVYRYVLAEVIHINDINPATRRKAGEGREERPIANTYLKPEFHDPVRKYQAGMVSSRQAIENIVRETVAETGLPAADEITGGAKAAPKKRFFNRKIGE